MITEQSPTVRKLRLGIELRQLRNRSGRTMLEAADEVARSDSTISRLETGQVSVSHRVLERLLDFYQATAEEREALRILAKQARQRGWWHAYGDDLPAGFEARLGLEAEAGSLSIYEAEAVPGLLQTEDYARALLEAEPSPPSDRRLGSLLTVREERQRRLAGDTAPTLSVILHEGVLHHQVGGAATMGEQLRRLCALSRQSHVSVRILPFAAGAHPAMRGGGFTVLSVALGGDVHYEVAHLEHRTGSLFLDRPSDVEEHKTVFGHLRDRALDGGRSRALIAQMADRMTG
jgi:transcriptional regulator with XRE-family HTH domain